MSPQPPRWFIMKKSFSLWLGNVKFAQIKLFGRLLKKLSARNDRNHSHKIKARPRRGATPVDFPLRTQSIIGTEPQTDSPYKSINDLPAGVPRLWKPATFEKVDETFRVAFFVLFFHFSALSTN